MEAALWFIGLVLCGLFVCAYGTMTYLHAILKIMFAQGKRARLWEQ